jgi:DNA-binding protein H-NS
MAKHTVDISQLDLDELNILSEQVKERIATLKEESRQKAYDQMVALATNVGLSPRELLRLYGDGGAAAPAPAGKPAYRNPANAQETWTGRGRKPAWVASWLAEGKPIEDLQAK